MKEKRKKSLFGLNTYPVVALLGRVNVGKSTFFNRLIGEEKAVTAALPGTTRDVNYGFCDWRGMRFVVVDTGGFSGKTNEDIEIKAIVQVKKIIKEADLLLFMVDGKHELHPHDREFLRIIRTLSKAPLLLIVNKVDKTAELQTLYEKEWMKLGAGEPFAISAVSGRGIGDLLDKIQTILSITTERPSQEGNSIRIAIVGRTNVGKSSILNQILGEDRVIVSPTPHTTREPQDMEIDYNGRHLILIDTVGMRRKSKVKSRIDREGLERSIRSIGKADVVILVLESKVTPSQQESRLVNIAKEAGAAVLLLVNKWDLVEEKDTKSVLAYERYFRDVFSFIPWSPFLFVSAYTGKRVTKILDAILTLEEQRERDVPQDQLDVFLKKALVKQKPIWLMGQKKPVVYGFKQVGKKPPTFSLVVNERTGFNYTYLRYLENRLRESFGFEGTPIRIHTEEHVVKRGKKI